MPHGSESGSRVIVISFVHLSVLGDRLARKGAEGAAVTNLACGSDMTTVAIPDKITDMKARSRKYFTSQVLAELGMRTYECRPSYILASINERASLRKPDAKVPVSHGRRFL